MQGQCPSGQAQTLVHLTQVASEGGLGKSLGAHRGKEGCTGALGFPSYASTRACFIGF